MKLTGKIETKGKFEGKIVEVEIGKDSTTSNVWVDGKRIEGVQEINIGVKVGELSMISFSIIDEKEVKKC